MKIYPVRVLLSISLLLFALLLAGCSRSAEPRRPEQTLQRLAAGETVRLVAFGDSVTRGYGVERPWPVLLEQQLRMRYPAATIEVVNAGIDGHTAADGVARIERDVLLHAPDLVLIAFGLNDLKFRRSPEAFSADLGRQIERITTAGGEVVLLTTNPVRAGIYGQALGSYNAAIRDLARHRGLPLVDVTRAWEEALDNLSADALLIDVAHPSERGQQVTATAVYQLFAGS